MKYTLQNRTQERNTITNNQNFTNEEPTSINKLNRIGENTNTLHQLSSNFKNKLKNGELMGGVIYSANTPNNWNSQTTQPIDIESGNPRSDYRIDEKTYDNNNQLLKSNIDLSQSFSKNTQLETGLLVSHNLFEQDLINKRTYYTQNNDGSTDISEQQIESNFRNTTNSAAGYALLSSKIKKYSMSAGLRLEYIYNRSESDSTITTSYLKLIPSLHIQKRVSDLYTWELSFTSRSKPPTYNQLNPISVSFGNYYKSSGNPNLKSEFFYQCEWNNRWKLEKSNYSLALFFRKQSDIIGRWYFLEEEDGKEVSHSIFENLGELQTLGIDFSSMLNFNKVKIRPSLVAFHSHISGDKFASTLDKKELPFTVKIAANYQLNKKINFQATGNYNSPFISVYGKQYAYFKVDAGARAKILKDKAILSLKVMDIFDSVDYDKTINQREDMLRTNHIDPKNILIYMNLSCQFNSLKKRGSTKNATRN